MKKLIAILLSVLMLCAMIPFATVAAAEGMTIVVEPEDYEFNEGDEFAVTVYFENNPGLCAADITISYDPTVFEVVGEWDEGEFYPEISHQRKWKANGFGYKFDEDKFTVQYTLATEANVTDETKYFEVLLAVKDGAYTGDYDLTVSFNPNNFFGRGANPGEFIPAAIAEVVEPTIHINGQEKPEEPSCEHEYEYDCSKNCKLCGELTRPEAEHEYFYACDPVCMICYEMTNPEAAHTMNHVEAKAATCTENGNIEYWYCDACGGCWDNENATGMPLNRMMVIVPAAGHSYFDDCSAICDVCGYEREVSHNVIHVDAVAADCTTDGNIEYWYCDVCGMAWLDAECTLNTNLMSVILPASCSYNAIHNEGVAAGCHYTGRLESWYCANCDVYYLDAACALITNYKSLTIPALQDTADHVAAKAPTCDEPGNVEYWICYECEQVWADAALTQLTNYKNVQLAPAHNVIHVEAKAATCFEPGNIEYWYCDVCGAAWTDELCREVTNLKNVVLPIAHNVIHVEAKAPTCTENGNIEYWYCDVCGSAWLDAECTLNTNLLSVKLPASCSYNVEYVAAKEATCFEPGNVEYWYCANCDVYYADAACAIVTNAKNVIIPITHNVIHVEAKAPTCTENGNIEYWYCDVCGSAWLDEYCHLNTNMMAVKLAASCKYGAQYVEAKAATCFEPGNTEYWYCANCDVYYADADCTIITNAKNVIIPITHNVIHVEAKDPTCTELGNIEFWYCADCGAAWLDELCHLNTNMMAVKLAASCKYGAQYVEAKAATCFEPGNTEYWYCANCDVYYADADCTIITNAKNVIIPITHNIIAVEAKAATCTEMGNIAYWYCADCGQAWLDEYCHLNTNLKAVVLPMAEHTYSAANDATCDVCGAERAIAAEDIIVLGGKSISEIKNGLAVKFDAAVKGITYNEEYIADYTNATVTIGGVEYKLIGMGAIANNKGYSAQTLADVDGIYVLDIPAVKVFEEFSYAVRIINIPADKLDAEITFCSYLQYECEGEVITVYGDDIVASYNGALNG